MTTAQRLALAAAGLVLCFALGLSGFHLYGSPLHTTNGGVVLWNCGPGLEVWGHPGPFTETECH